MLSPIGEWFAKLADEAFAVCVCLPLCLPSDRLIPLYRYLGDHVMQGYEWLMKVYRPGDKVTIFGFSRGAYTGKQSLLLESDSVLLADGQLCTKLEH